MPARRKAADAELRRIDAVARGIRADQAHGPLRILQRHVLRIIPAFARQAIGEREDGNAGGVQCLGDVDPFILDRDEAIAAAGDGEDGGAVGAGRAEHADNRIGHAAQP